MSLSTRTRRRVLTRGVRRRLRRLLGDDAGMSTVEYAIGCVAAAPLRLLPVHITGRAMAVLEPGAVLSGGGQPGGGGP